MVTSDNNDEKDDTSGDLSAESLYKQYRLKRSTARTEATPSESDVPETLLTSTSPERLYQSYTKTRTSVDESAVDSIMKSISANNALDIIHSDNSDKASIDQPVVGSSTHEPKIQSVADNTSNVFKQLKRVAVVAVAATVFGIVLIPRLSGPTFSEYSLQAVVPNELLNNANQAIAHVQVPTTSTFGFTDSTDVSMQRFNRGVIAADLSLAVDANRNELLLPLVRNLSQTYEAGIHSDNLAALQEFIDTANEGEKSDDTGLRESLDKALSLEEDQANEEGQLSWYLHGHAVESIRIAAEVFLNGGDESILKESLAYGQGLALPASTRANTSAEAESTSTSTSATETEIASESSTAATTVVELLKRLYSIQLSDGDAYSQAAQVLSASQSVLALKN